MSKVLDPWVLLNPYDVLIWKLKPYTWVWVMLWDTHSSTLRISKRKQNFPFIWESGRICFPHFEYLLPFSICASAFSFRTLAFLEPNFYKFEALNMKAPCEKRKTWNTKLKLTNHIRMKWLCSNLIPLSLASCKDFIKLLLWDGAFSNWELPKEPLN